MKSLLLLLVVSALLVAAGCGADEMPTAVDRREAAPREDDRDVAPPKEDRDVAPRKADRERAPRKGTRVTLRGSEFGDMLFDSKRQAIYVFEKDPKGETVCYGECADAWPPVVTKGEPVAGRGVDAGLLGTVERRDGTLQVTYADRPLYYYAHEAPGEVRCHNVNLNGGFWWVVGPDGERLA